MKKLKKKNKVSNIRAQIRESCTSLPFASVLSRVQADVETRGNTAYDIHFCKNAIKPNLKEQAIEIARLVSKTPLTIFSQICNIEKAIELIELIKASEPETSGLSVVFSYGAIKFGNGFFITLKYC